MPIPEATTVAHAPLARLVRDTAAAHPDLVAVDAPDGALTYRELLERASELAARLRGAGTVAVTGERGAALVTAVLAVVLAPARLVTVDPELPAARRAEMIERSGADLVLDLGRPLREAVSGGEPPADPGYLFFTSGTSARPKAVLGRQASVAHFVGWQRDQFGLRPGDRFAQLTAISFDVVLRDLFTPLVSGATICVPPADVATRVGGVPGWLREAGITVTHTVPSLATRWTAGEAGEPIDALRLTFFAGEPLAEATVRRWRTWFPASRVVNLYGPTETTLAKFWHEIEAPTPGVQAVGRPLPGTEFRLVDGEVWIRTPHGTDGYLDSPDEQRARFVGSWYRTGDLGEVDERRDLRLRGRADFQVKINGNRVEPEGVAAELRDHPLVRDAVVVAGTRIDGAAYLAAFYTGSPADDLRDWLGARLPASHVPSVLRHLGELPLTANGKVDRSALPDPLAAADAPVAAAADDLEAAVRAAFERVLGVDHPDADFFDHGGTSLDSAELVGLLLAGTGRLFEMSELYRLRTPRAVTDAARVRAGHTQDVIRNVEQLAVTGLSAQQRRYRNVYLPRVNRSWSNMPALFALPDGTEASAVEAALATVLRRHDSLRASFEELDDGSLRQRFAAHIDVRIDIVDLNGHADQGTELERLRVVEANAPIDITAAPLFRARLIRHHGDRATLLWTVHHMVSDGYSQQVLRKELLSLLDGGSLPELPISYRDYISWQQTRSVDQAQRAYWREVFARPYERPLLPDGGETEQPARGISYQFPIPDDLRAWVDVHCRSHGVTAFSVYFAAYFLMAHRLFDRDDLVIGTPAAGRARPEVTNMIGNFISLVGVRHRRGELPAFADLVATLQERAVRAMEHQDYQYDQVMADVGADRDDDRFPLTTVFISLVDVPAEQSAALREPAHRDLGCEVKFDLMGYLRRSPDAMALDLNTRKGLLLPERLEQLRDVFLAELRTGLAA